MGLKYTENPGVVVDDVTGDLFSVDNKNQRYRDAITLHGYPLAYIHPPETSEDIIAKQFPEDGVMRVLFEALFEIANRLQALEGKQSITRTQLRNWLISKLPVKPITQNPSP